MVGEHDAARADADRFCARCDMTDHNRRRGAGDARHVVMLRHPDAAIAPGFGMNRNIAGVVLGAARIGVFGWSYGGFQTLMLMAKASDRIAAGATTT